MAYFLLIKGKAGLCLGASSYRNNSGWHDVLDIGRPLSGSGYRYRGRDELNRRVDIRLVSNQRSTLIADLLSRDGTVPWVAVEAAYNGKAQSWWTFFDVSGAGYSAGTDDASPTRGSIAHILEFRSARWATGTWPGAIRTEVPKVGLDPGRVVDRDTDQAITTLPVPESLKRGYSAGGSY